MGTIAEKLKYTSDAVDDIQAAINEKGVEVLDTTPLNDYGDKIRDIRTWEEPTFKPWFDFKNVYYGLDESDISWQNSTYFYTDFTAFNLNLGEVYVDNVSENITFETFNNTTINIVENTY